MNDLVPRSGGPILYNILIKTGLSQLLSCRFGHHPYRKVQRVTDVIPRNLKAICWTVLLKFYSLFAGLAAIAYKIMIKLIILSPWNPPQLFRAKSMAKEG